MKKPTSPPKPKPKKERRAPDSESRYRDLFAHMTEGVALCKMKFKGKTPLDFQYLAVNSAFETQTGLKNVEGHWVSEIIPGIRESDPELFAIYGRVAKTGKPEKFEMNVKSMEMCFSVSVYSPQKDHFVAVFEVITKRKIAEDELRMITERFSLATRAAKIAVWDWDIPANRLIWDDRMYELYGVRREDFSGAYEAWLAGIHPADKDRCDQESQQARCGERPYDTEFRVVWPGGSIHFIKAEGVVIRDADGVAVRMIGVNYDITQAKESEKERETAIGLLRLLGSANNTRELMQSVLTYIQDWSGCEAVGVRLREGEDYPYFETSGFPTKLIQAERSLCAKNQEGFLVRDANGNAVLECMCGNILCGRTNPAKNFFTPHGSFWSNNTTALLATTTDADRQTQTRNRCNREGYESVALIPLRASGKTFGLLQMNDRRTGMFTPEFIAQAERLGDNLAIGLAQRQAADALRENEKLLRAAQRIAQIGHFKFDPKTRTMDGSDEFYRIFGIAREQFALEPFSQNIDAEDFTPVNEQVNNALEKGQPFEVEFRFVCPDGAHKSIRTNGEPVLDRQGRTTMLVGTVQDITESKRAEQALQASSIRYRRLFESAMDGILILNADSGVVVDANPSFCELLGYPQEKILGKRLWEIGLFQDIAASQSAFLDLQERGYLRHEDLPFEAADGRWMEMDIVGNVYLVGEEKVIQCNIRDVSERKRMEKSLLASEERYRTIANSISDYIYTVWVEDGKPVETIHGVACEAVTGYSPMEFADDPNLWIRMVHPEDREDVRIQAEQTLFNGKSKALEHRIIRKDKTEHWVRSVQVAHCNKAGRLISYDGLITDITERKLAELELRESEERYRLLAENISDVIWILDLESLRFTYVSPSVEKLLGYSPEEMIAQPVAAALTPVSQAKYREVISQRVGELRAGILRSYLDELKQPCKDGSTVWTETTTRYAQDELGHILIYGATRDISQRRKAEEELEIMKFSIDSAPNSAYWMDESGRFTYFNEIAHQSLGYSRDELMQLSVFDVNPRVTPEGWEDVWRILREKKSYVSESEHRRKDGSCFPVEISSAYVQYGGREFVNGFATDISERKRAEAEIRESEEKFRMLFNTMAQGVVYQDADGRIINANPAAEQILGLSLDQMRGRTSVDPGWRAIHEDGSEFPGEEHPIPVALKTGNEVRNVVHGVFNPHLGEFRWITVNAVPQFRRGEDRPYQAYATFEDITDRRRAEEALRQESALLEAQLNSSLDGILVVDGDGKKILQNKRTIELWKIPMHIADNPDDQVQVQYVTGMTKNPAEFGEKIKYLYRHPTESSHDEVELLDGTILDRNSAPVLGKDGKNYGRCWTFHDSTDRKLAEQALKQSEQRFAAAFNHTNVSMTIAELGSGRFLDMNDTFCVSVGYERAKLLGKSAAELGIFRDPSSRIAFVAPAIAAGFVKDVELEYVRRDGEIRLGSFSGSVIGLEGKSYLLATMLDVTERKRAEEELRISEERFRSIFEFAAAGMVLVDLEMRFVQVNDFFCKMLGYSPNELLTRSFQDVTYPEDRAMGGDKVRTVLEGKQDWFQIEKRYVRKDGTIVWGLVSSTLIRDLQKRPVYFVTQIQDITERKLTELALHESEARFRSIVTDTQAGYFFFDKEGIVRDVNPAWVKLYRYDSADEVIGQHFAILRQIEDLDKTKDVIQGILRNDSRYLSGEFSRKCKDGTIGYHSFSARPVSKKGEIVGIEGFIVDITERKKMENALRESEEKYRTLFESMQEGVALQKIVFGAQDEPVDYQIMDVNPSFERQLGFRREDVIGKLATVVYGISEAPYLKEYADVASTGKTFRFETYFPPLNKYYDISVISPAKGLFATVFLDITERKQAEEELRVSENRFRRMFENAAIGEVLVSPSLQFIQVNNFFCQMLGYSAEELLTKSFQDVTHPEDRSIGGDLVRDVLEGKREWFQLEKRYERKDGSFIWGLVSATLIRNARNQPLYLAAQIQNVTERRRAEEDVRALNESLERRVAERTANLETANREMEAFSYSISHDLRAPLRAIDGYMKILMEENGQNLGAAGLKTSLVIRENAKRMGKLIDELLELSRVSRREMRATKIDMAEMVGGLYEELTTPVDRLRIDFRLDAIPPIEGDPVCLHQIWTNLLANAIKFSSKKTKAVIEVEAEETPDEIVYVIRDNGAGFEMEYSAKLFGVFQRLHSTKEFEGTGVGLAIVQRLVQRHGGRVWAEGEPEKGAAFYFSIPKKAKP